jgi:hypothetical protein
LFYFVFCGDFDFVPSCPTPKTGYNMVLVKNGLPIISIFGGGDLI